MSEDREPYEPEKIMRLRRVRAELVEKRDKASEGVDILNAEIRKVDERIKEQS